MNLTRSRSILPCLRPALISILSIIIDAAHSAPERMRGEKLQTRIARIAIGTHQQAFGMGCRIIALHPKERASEPD